MTVDLIRYENATAPQLCALLEGDRVAFAVMRNILAGHFGPVGKIITDGARMIVTYTCPPYPAWAWLPEDASEAEMARCWQVMREALPPEKGYCFNVRPGFAQYMLHAPEGRALRIHRRLSAYACGELATPARRPQGRMFLAKEAELTLAAQWALALSEEENLDLRPYEEHLEEMRGFIERRRLLMWRTDSGKITCMCAVTEEEGLGYISRVYTPPAHRRRGYAAALVHDVAHCLLVQGIRPALCTNADYAPSNACYRKIGFQPAGGFVTIGL